MITRQKLYLCAALLFLCMSSTGAWAQITSQTGAITGTVTDPTGAIVPNAKITITSDRGTSQVTTSSGNGDFTFPLLQPGSYRLSVEAAGFNKATVQDVRVQITEIAKVPVALAIGSETVEISVSDTAQTINTTQATLGQVLPGKQIEELPLATRNFTNLLALNAATSADIPDASVVGRGSSTVYVNGQRGTANNLVINGIDANNLGSNNFGSVPIPAPDTLEEFRVQTSLYDASQGKTSGGNVNVITRGGDAHYHGQLYEFFRNEDLNANSWFFNKNRVQKAIVRQNQFGGNFGGPVPKIGKTFFFGSYEGTRQLNGLSGAINTNFPVLPANRTRSGIESAFGLKPGTLDPVSLNLLNAKGVYNGFLIPSASGAAPGQFGTINISQPTRFNDDQFNANGDHQFGDNHRLSLRYFRAIAATTDPLGGQGGGNLGSGQASPIRNHLASISLTSSLRPTLVNEARIGLNRILTAAVANEPVTGSQVGISKFNSALFPGIPVFFTNDINPAFGGISTNNDQVSVSNTFHVSDTLAYIRGSHSFRAGFEGRFYQVNTFNNFASRGFISFNTFQDFLTGNLLQTFIGTGQTYRDFRAHDLSGYFQDDYKVTRRLTLNLGVRYDYLSPSTDRRHRLGNFDPSLLDANTLANGGPGLLKGYVIPSSANFGSIKGTPGVSESTLTNANNKNFAPRVGFAYDVFGNGKTAVRGGYGIYYVRTSNQTLLQLLTAAPFFQLSNIGNPGTTFANPFPALPVPSDFPILPVPAQFTGFNAAGSPIFSGPLLTINPIQRNLRTPYAEHYNFSIQQQLPAKFALEVGYVGSQGVRLLQSLQENQARLANSSQPIRGLTANSSRNANARVLVAGFSPQGLNEVTDNGHSSYNALIATLNRRFGGTFFQAAYTFSRSIDNNSGSAGQDLGNSGGNQLAPQLNRGLSNFDRTHRLQMTYTYDLQFFKTGMLHHVIGGWTVGGLTTFQSALPINFGCACGSGSIYGITGGLYPVLTGDFSNIKKQQDPRRFTDPGTSMYNTGILAVVPTLPSGAVLNNKNRFGGPSSQSYPIGGNGTGPNTGQEFGTLPRNTGLRGPFQQQWDFFAAKAFPIRENLRLQFRSEFFNLFNHPIFAAPISTVGSPSFGLVTSTTNAPRIIQFAAKLQF